ncbi:hypothetical protein RUM43_005831 [Polyplax serrata]|uniref:Calpain catalytic domain-containing protein n=1 Tax=Polyplax serrata TaxID=468196 RepID=A0AAN8NQX3_POLSC
MGCINSSMISNANAPHNHIEPRLSNDQKERSSKTRIIQNEVVDYCVSSIASEEQKEPTGKFIDGLLGLCDNQIIIEKLSKLSQGELFEDEEFPADSTSLCFSQPPAKFYDDVVWLRPFQISNSPYLFVDGTSRRDVKQGILGNCWFLSACASVAKRQDLVEKVIDPSQHLFGDGYRGILLINFWRFGEWVTVNIDDRLPTKNGHLIFGSCINENEFWLALVEKAYAKLHGSYEALIGGHALEAFVDLTGGIAETVRISPDCFKQLTTVYMHGAFITCSRKAEGNHHEICRHQAPNAKGLIEGHAYTVTYVATVDLLDGETVELVRVRNPWGDAVEWDGAWSDRSANWNNVSEFDKKRLRILAMEDGEFWMEFDDFQEEFEELTIATIGPDFNQDGLADTPLEVGFIKSSWKKGVNAGGCRNDLEKFALNPQYLLHLKESNHAEGEEMCSVLIGLMQEHRRSQKNRRLSLVPIAFFIYKAETPLEKLGAEYFLCIPEESNSGDFTDCREVILRIDLEPGYYVIIPATFHPDSETNFMIRVFALRPFTLAEMTESKETDSGLVNDASSCSTPNLFDSTAVENSIETIQP